MTKSANNAALTIKFNKGRPTDEILKEMTDYARVIIDAIKKSPNRGRVQVRLNVKEVPLAKEQISLPL